MPRADMKSRMRGRAIRWRYAAAAALLSAGAPIGWLAIRAARGAVAFGIAAEVSANAALYLYLAAGTALAFGGFGYVAGLLAERLAAARGRYEELSVTDALTGLKNARYFGERLKSEIARGERERQPLSVIAMDLDHFKRVNDRLGHAAGDAALAHAARVLREHVRVNDVPCRTGGEEFTVICPGARLEDAQAVAERIRAGMAARGFRWEDGEEPLTASFGVATFRGATAALLREADEALYEAKEAGRNRVQVARSPSAA